MKFPFLRYNPFPVKAWFDSSCTLTFAVPAAEVQALLPLGLKPDVFEENGQSWGFVAVAVVSTRNLRPSFFPERLGDDFILLGYRFFVRCPLANGRTLRGLYILRSETDRAKMVRLGNFFTQYRYVFNRLKLTHEAHRLHLSSEDSELKVIVKLESGSDVPLPQDSPFKDWKSARRFCGPMPYTFSVEKGSKHVWMVEGKRSHWIPQPVEVLDYHIPWLDTFTFSQIRLANAFVVQDVPYEWARGRRELLA